MATELDSILTVDPTNGSNKTWCVQAPISPTFGFILYGISICISIAIFVTLAFIKRRARLAPRVCEGRPGLPIPMDFLIAPRHRWIYVAIFSVMAVSAFQIFQNLNNQSVSANLYLNLFLKILIWPLLAIMIISLLYFPLFGCVDAAVPLVGHIMGLIYSLLWYTMVLAVAISGYIQGAVTCTENGHIINKSGLCVFIFQDAPHLIVDGSIVVWYLYQVILGLTKFCQRQNQRRRGFANFAVTNGYTRTVENVRRFPTLCRDYQVARVKALLRRPLVVDATQSRLKGFLMKVKRYVIPFDKHFRLPLPFLGAVAAMVMLLYQFCFIFGIVGVSLAAQGRRLYNQMNVDHPLLRNIFDITLNGIPALLVLAPILALIVCLLLLVHMIGSISKMMKTVAREGFKETLPGVLSRVPASWKYIGLQIGFFMCAWLIYYAIFLLLGALLIGLYIFLRLPQSRIWTINTIIGILVPVIWARIIFYSQFLVCKFLFFADKEGKFISITNRNVFSWFSFILFFYNGLAGFVGAVFRIAMSAIFSLILLFRLDEVALMKKFDAFDFGHKAFLGFFYLDYAYNNAVMHVFIENLKDSLDSNLSTPSSSGSTGMEEESDRIATHRFPPANMYSRQRIRNRWLVAYTLIRNPSLVNMTASNLPTTAASQQIEKEGLVESCSEASIQVHKKYV